MIKNLKLYKYMHIHLIKYGFIIFSQNFWDSKIEMNIIIFLHRYLILITISGSLSGVSIYYNL